MTSLVWAFVPLYTIGFGTVAVLGWAAVRLRSLWLAVCAIVAVLIVVGVLALPDGSSLGGGLIVLGPISGGLVATFIVRGKLVRPTRGPAELAAGDPSGSSTATVDPAVRDALAHRTRRAEARRILETDPALARELCIGRPDLPREYDDGGILDVNHVPADALAALPGFTPEVAARVVEAREECGGFTLLTELVVYADVPEELAEELADRLVFLS